MSDVEIHRPKRRSRPGAERTTACGLSGSNPNDARRNAPTTERPAEEVAQPDGSDAPALITFTRLSG